MAAKRVECRCGNPEFTGAGKNSAFRGINTFVERIVKKKLKSLFAGVSVLHSFSMGFVVSVSLFCVAFGVPEF